MEKSNMNTEKMTVHQGLAELKVLAKRIEKESATIRYVMVNKHSNEKISGIPVGTYVEDTRNRYKSLRTLINRRNAIKQAITKSNAETTVTIAGQSVSVASAIDMKNYGVDYLRDILNNMMVQQNDAINHASRQNGDALESRADNYIRNLYENTDMKNMSDEVKKVREDFIKTQTLEIVDPVNIVAEMEKLKDYIDKFTVSVDSALSVSNAITEIEVRYECY
jgi:hypothetical protein